MIIPGATAVTLDCTSSIWIIADTAGFEFYRKVLAGAGERCESVLLCVQCMLLCRVALDVLLYSLCIYMESTVYQYELYSIFYFPLPTEIPVRTSNWI